MKSEDPSHGKHALVVPFEDAERIKRLRKSPTASPSCDPEHLTLLSSLIRDDRPETKAMSDDEWRQRSVDNIMALLKANAELRALALKLSDILAARGGWDRNSLDKLAEAARPQMRQPRQS
jgi:hypothetical protein